MPDKSIQPAANVSTDLRVNDPCKPLDTRRKRFGASVNFLNILAGNRDSLVVQAARDFGVRY